MSNHSKLVELMLENAELRAECERLKAKNARLVRFRVALNTIELIATPGRTPPYLQGKSLGAKLDEVSRIAHQALAGIGHGGGGAND